LSSAKKGQPLDQAQANLFKSIDEGIPAGRENRERLFTHRRDEYLKAP